MINEICQRVATEPTQDVAPPIEHYNQLQDHTQLAFESISTQDVAPAIEHFNQLQEPAQLAFESISTQDVAPPIEHYNQENQDPTQFELFKLSPPIEIEPPSQAHLFNISNYQTGETSGLYLPTAETASQQTNRDNSKLLSLLKNFDIKLDKKTPILEKILTESIKKTRKRKATSSICPIVKKKRKENKEEKTTTTQPTIELAIPQIQDNQIIAEDMVVACHGLRFRKIPGSRLLEREYEMEFVGFSDPKQYLWVKKAMLVSCGKHEKRVNNFFINIKNKINL